MSASAAQGGHNNVTLESRPLKSRSSRQNARLFWTCWSLERRNQRETLWIINLLYDNAPVQKSKKVQAAILECRFQDVSHPPYWHQVTVFIAVLNSRCEHYIFVLFLSSSSFFPFFSCLISAVADWMSTILLCMVWPYCKFRIQVWNMLHTACWKCRTQKIGKKSPYAHHHTTLLSYILATKACINNRKKNLLNSNISSTCPHNVANFDPLVAEVDWWVWGTPANFNGFRVLAALLHGTLVVDISQTLRRWTEGATYIWQGGHHVGHWPTF